MILWLTALFAIFSFASIASWMIGSISDSGFSGLPLWLTLAFGILAFSALIELRKLRLGFAVVLSLPVLPIFLSVNGMHV